MAKYIRQPINAETVTIKIGPFVSIIDLTYLATATITAASVHLSKNGGGFAQKNESTAPPLDENGYYLVTLGIGQGDRAAHAHTRGTGACPRAEGRKEAAPDRGHAM